MQSLKVQLYFACATSRAKFYRAQPDSENIRVNCLSQSMQGDGIGKVHRYPYGGVEVHQREAAPTCRALARLFCWYSAAGGISNCFQILDRLGRYAQLLIEDLIGNPFEINGSQR